MRAELLNLGKDYPQGFAYFRPRLHRAFMTNAHIEDEDEIRKGIQRAEFVKKGKCYLVRVQARRFDMEQFHI